MMLSITFSEDLAAFAKRIEQFGQNVKKEIPNQFSDFIGVLIDNTPVDTGYLMMNWEAVKTDDGMVFGNSAAYAHVLEEGLYQGVGKTGKTVPGTHRAGIFSSQAPDGIIEPIVREPEKYGVDERFTVAVDKCVDYLMQEVGGTF